MRKGIFLTLVIVIIAGLFVGCGNAIGGGGSGNRNLSVFSISDIADDPLAFTGEIIIRGLVMGFSENDPTLFGIEEPGRRSCCAPIILPVRYNGNGTMPEIGDIVNVTGSWGDPNEGIIFLAARVDIR